MTEYKIHPSDPNYNAALRDVVMDMAPFYDPNHRCGIVRDKIFHGCLEELREREKLTSMKLERERDEWRAVAEEALVSFRCTQKLEDYPEGHWSRRAQTLLKHQHKQSL